MQEEEEVEDELAALEAEVAKKEAGVQRLPNVPDTQLPVQNKIEEGSRSETAAQKPQRERQAMLAS